MSTHDKSITHNRPYGDIIGSIFSKGSGDLDEKQDSSVSEAKRLFRERRQKSSPGRNLSRNATPERRQNPSPIRRFNELRSELRSGNNSRPPTPDRSNRPPTPDRLHVRSRSRGYSSPVQKAQNKNAVVVSSTRDLSKSPSRTRENRLSSTQLEPYQYQGKGISTRALSISPARRRDQGIDSSESVQDLTTRVAKQLLKEIPKKTGQEQKVAEISTSESLEQESKQTKNNQIPHIDEKLEQKAMQAKTTDEIDQPPKLAAKIPASEELSRTTEKEIGDAASSSPEDLTLMKKTIQAQNEHIAFYESRLKERSNDIEKLNLELMLSKKNQANLELELDIHDLKYSMYDDHRRLMDRQRLDDKNDEEGDEIEIELENSPISKIIRGLFSKLDRLDQLYEKSKTEAKNRFSILHDEYNIAISKISLLERERSNSTSNISSVATTVTGINSTSTLVFYEKRMKILESENLKYSLDLQRKGEELEKAKAMQTNSTNEKNKNEFNTHNIEKQTLTNKIAALETEIGFTSGHIDDKTRTRRYRALEKNLNEYIVEIMGLEDKLKAKEKVNSKLKEMDLTQNFGFEKRNSWDHVSESSTKWYERNENGGKASTKILKPVTGAKLSADRFNGLDHVSESFTKWYERNRNGEKASTMISKPVTGAKLSADGLNGLDYASEPTTTLYEGNKNGEETATKISKSLAGENIETVSREILKMRSRINKKAGEEHKIESKKSKHRKGPSSSSTRIAMLRRRLDALANDHSSVCTEETNFSGV